MAHAWRFGLYHIFADGSGGQSSQPDGERCCVLSGEEHSEESYNQVLEDIKHYRSFCRDNDDYENDKATNAIEHINHCYMQVKAENKFI